MAKGPNQSGVATSVSASHPESRGKITLKSTDPFDYPALDPQNLTEERDINAGLNRTLVKK